MLTQTAIRNGFFKQPRAQSPGAPLAVAAAQAGTIELMGACMSFPANSEIYGENEPADYLYKIVSGTVRTYKVLVDGRRQIGAFYLPGDIFGLETADEHTFSAEAITDCKITVIKRSAVMALAAHVVVVSYGEKIAEGTPLEITRHQAVLDVYLGEEEVA
jgi:CRP/FNR family nitrogen fixation transcriptional regulator